MAHPILGTWGLVQAALVQVAHPEDGCRAYGSRCSGQHRPAHPTLLRHLGPQFLFFLFQGLNPKSSY